jgi:ferredoxin
MSDVYRQLQQHLDRLPGGYPATDSGVEIRILKRLFTPEEADLALHLRMKPESAGTVAERIGRPETETAERLMAMSRQGLIFSIETMERPAVFMASQFMVGIWEYQVNRLDRAFLEDMDEYFPVLSPEAFSHLPQLRTIPVGRSVKADLNILAYEEAASLVHGQTRFLVAPCICRREHEIKGGGCDKPVETCLVFGWGVDYYQRNGLGRVINLEETLEILKKAEEAGLVLQPGNSQEISNICCCCGDCCQVLLHLKRQADPAAAAAASFVIEADTGACLGCEICVDRCQMGALNMAEGVVVVEARRCIGCGLCVTTCSGEALTLKRKPEEDLKTPPRNSIEALMARAQARSAAQADLESKIQRHRALD